MPTFLLFVSFSTFLPAVFPIGIGFTLTARRSAHTHQSLSLETLFRIMNTFHSNAPKPLSPGYLTPRHVLRGEENTSTIPIRSPTTKKGGGMSALMRAFCVVAPLFLSGANGQKHRFCTEKVAVGSVLDRVGSALLVGTSSRTLSQVLWGSYCRFCC